MILIGICISIVVAGIYAIIKNRNSKRNEWVSWKEFSEKTKFISEFRFSQQCRKRN